MGSMSHDLRGAGPNADNSSAGLLKRGAHLGAISPIGLYWFHFVVEQALGIFVIFVSYL